MRKVRIVVADEREVNFFEGSKADGPLTACGSLHNETGGLRDIELEADREGRRYGQMGHHHGVDGERSTERHELTVFAKEVSERIDKDRVNGEFDKLVIVAPPRMLGLLRQSLSGPSQAMLAGEISKDVVRHGPDAIRSVVPREAFSQLQ